MFYFMESAACLPRSGFVQQAAGEGLGKAVPFFERQCLIDSLRFYQSFRLSLPIHSALRYRVTNDTKSTK